MQKVKVMEAQVSRSREHRLVRSEAREMADNLMSLLSLHPVLLEILESMNIRRIREELARGGLANAAHIKATKDRLEKV